jgi:hypothetical protein
VADIPVVKVLVATFVERADDGMVQVDFGQGPVTILSAGVAEPLPGQSVRVLQVDATTMMLGPAVPRSGIGVVTATGSPTLTVTTSVGSLALPFIATYSAVNGDTVLIDWDAGGVVIGKVTAAPAGSYTPPVGSATAFSVDFRATDSGSYYSGSWVRDDLWASDSNKGAWFYGTTIPDTIPDTATITRVQVYLPEFYNPFPAELAGVGLHALSSKVGALALSSVVGVAAGAVWQDLPVTFGDALKTGASLGVGVQQLVALSGYHKYTGRASDADSGLLRIDWTV